MSRAPIRDLQADQRKLARFFAQAVIGHRLDLEDSFKVRWIGDRLEEIDRRKAARDDAKARRPVDGGNRDFHDQPR